MTPSSSFRHITQIDTHEIVQVLKKTFTTTPPFTHSLITLTLFQPVASVKTSINDVTFSHLDITDVPFLPLIRLLAQRTASTPLDPPRAQTVPTEPLSRTPILNPWWVDFKGKLNIIADQDTVQGLGLRGPDIIIRKNYPSNGSFLISIDLRGSIGGVPLFSPLSNGCPGKDKDDDLINRLLANDRLYLCSRVAAALSLDIEGRLKELCRSYRIMNISPTQELKMMPTEISSGLTYQIFKDELLCREFIDSLGWALIRRKDDEPDKSVSSLLSITLWKDILYESEKIEEIIKRWLVSLDEQTTSFSKAVRSRGDEAENWMCLLFQTSSSGDSVIVLIKRNLDHKLTVNLIQTRDEGTVV